MNNFSVGIRLWHHIIPGRAVDIDISLYDRTYYGELDRSPIGIAAYKKFTSEEEALAFVEELKSCGWDVASTEYEYLKLKCHLESVIHG